MSIDPVFRFRARKPQKCVGSSWRWLRYSTWPPAAVTPTGLVSAVRHCTAPVDGFMARTALAPAEPVAPISRPSAYCFTEVPAGRVHREVTAPVSGFRVTTSEPTR